MLKNQLNYLLYKDECGKKQVIFLRAGYQNMLSCKIEYSSITIYGKMEAIIVEIYIIKIVIIMKQQIIQVIILKEED